MLWCVCVCVCVVFLTCGAAARRQRKDATAAAAAYRTSGSTEGSYLVEPHLSMGRRGGVVVQFVGYLEGIRCTALVLCMCVLVCVCVLLRIRAWG